MQQIGRFQRSWQLFKSSMAVMSQQPRLLVFPILTFLITAGIAVLFLSPFVALLAAQWIHSAASHRAAAPQAAQAIVGVYFIVTYFVSMFCATFLNVAFYHQILEALQGRPVSIANGLKFACTRWKSVLLWSVFAGIVGYIIRALEQRFGLFGRLIMGLVGTAWSVACVFVIPVMIVDENYNPWAILKKSVATLKQTWGEALIGYAGVTFGSALVMLGSLLWLGAGVAAAVVLKSILLGATMFAGWLLAIFAFAYVTSVANQIFRCALFLFASTGAMPQPFDAEMAALAWKVKNS